TGPRRATDVVGSAPGAAAARRELGRRERGEDRPHREPDDVFRAPPHRVDPAIAVTARDLDGRAHTRRDHALARLRTIDLDHPPLPAADPAVLALELRAPGAPDGELIDPQVD